MASEEMNRRIEKSHQEEFARLSGALGMAAQYPGYEVQKEASRQQAAQQYACPGPVCAHLTVGYVRQYLGAGRERGWWQCVECDQKFIPSGTVKA